MKCNVVARPVSRMLRATASSQIGPMSYQTGQGRSGATSGGIEVSLLATARSGRGAAGMVARVNSRPG
jgi:hypothetical protein